jgi:hypothetical protein
MSTRMQQRRGTAAQWVSTNTGNGPILSPGEIGFESDTNKFKIGDGVNHWVDLTYFTDADSAIAALTGLVDGAPDLLNTLSELAASLGNDPAFFTTVATNLSSHEADTTNIHGIADTSLLATEAYVDTAVGNVTIDLSTAAGEGLDWNIATEQFDVGTLTSPTISTDLTLDGTGDFTISTDSAITFDATVLNFAAGVGDLTISADANIVLNPTTEVYIGSASAGNEVSTKSYADAAAAAIVDSAPATLDTLNELAAALGDDANFATTVTDSIAAKAPLVSPTFTGTVDLTGATVTGLPDSGADINLIIMGAY